MPIKDTGTEQLLKETAKRIFFAEGRLRATTQDIADAAGVNRAAVHYYFRSRDQLVAMVFHEAMLALGQRMGYTMQSARPFREKVESLIEVYLADMLAFPYQETFMIIEINSVGQGLIQHIDDGPVKMFLSDVEKEMENGEIEKMEAVQFLINLFSLLSYPFIMAPLYKQLFNLSENDFSKIIKERKEIICKMIFKKLF